MALRAIKLILTLTCDESSRIVSEGLDRDLSNSERTAVWAHRLVCWSCRRLSRQLRFLRDAVERREAAVLDLVNDRGPTLSHEARATMRAAIKRAAKEGESEAEA